MLFPPPSHPSPCDSSGLLWSSPVPHPWTPRTPTCADQTSPRPLRKCPALPRATALALLTHSRLVHIQVPGFGGGSLCSAHQPHTLLSLPSVGRSATHALVLAQLICSGARRGMHAFIVPIRSLQDHSLLPGKPCCSLWDPSQEETPASMPCLGASEVPGESQLVTLGQGGV